MLIVQNVSAGYGAFQALFDVSIEVLAGEAIAVIGPNGAGKTSLLRDATETSMATGMPSQGVIPAWFQSIASTLDGKPISPRGVAQNLAPDSFGPVAPVTLRECRAYFFRPKEVDEIFTARRASFRRAQAIPSGRAASIPFGSAWSAPVWRLCGPS